MPEELKEKAASQDAEPDKTPSNADLDAAANLDDVTPIADEDKGGDEPPAGEPEDVGAADEPPAGEPEDEGAADEPPVEPDDNAVRSKLGRKVYDIEHSVQALTNTINTFLQAQQKGQPPEEIDPVDDDIDPDAPLSIREWEAYSQKKQATANKAVEDYRNGYVRSVYEMSKSETDNALYQEILTELDNTQTYGERTGNAMVDAQLNYLLAKNNILSSRVSGKKPVNPLDKNKGIEVPPTKLTAGSQVPGKKAAAAPELDAAAKDFLAYTEKKGGPKLTPEIVAEALDKPFLTGSRDLRKV